MILVCDFDGVLCDSLNECMFSAYNAYQSLKAKDKKTGGIGQIDPELRKNFLRLRPYIRSGEDYLLIFSILENKIIIKSQDDFDNFKDKNKNFLSVYKKLLYKERDYLLKENKKLWLDLSPLFDIRYFFTKHNNFSNVFILTTKLKKYVIEILNFRKVDFRAENILYTKPENKVKNLLSLIKNCNSSPSNTIFVDDQIDYLIKAKKSGIKCFLVEWSYASKEQKEKAKKNAIPVINCSDFRKLIKRQV